MNYKDYLSITPEIEEAIRENKPIVALESTILSHGMPYPENIEFAHKVKPVTGDEFVRDLDASDLAQGVHRISLVNGKGPSGNYWGPDFVRLDLIAPPNGTMLILR